MSNLANDVGTIDVLITEDDPSLRQMLRHQLERQGYRCAEADNGREALEIARQSPPRLVLLDLMMPVLDGFAAAQQLHEDPRTHDVPIYFLTACADPIVRRKAQRIGSEAFLTKPLDCADLLDVVRVAMVG
jgi:two-component system phosphate regulon response regulator PhoB